MTDSTTDISLEEIVRQRTKELSEANERISIELRRRKAYESAFLENSKNYRAILNNIQEGFFEVNLSGKLTFFNNAMCTISGYSPDELTGAHYSGFTSKSTAESLFSVFNTVYTTGTPGKIRDYEMIRKDGSSRFLAISVSLVRDNSGIPIGFRGIARDITERKQAEKKLERYKKELEARVQERTSDLIKANMALVKAKEIADKSARAKTEFLANMSHEIRTPLNAIIGISELMSDIDNPARQKEYINIIRSSSSSLLDLVNDILDYSKIDAGKLDIENVSFNLREVIDDITDMFLEKNISKELELIIDVRDDIPDELYGDPLRLRQVLANLVSNAFKFTDSGEICISVQMQQSEADRIELLFTIKDTGIGIDPALWQNSNNSLFEAFAQADGSTTRKYGGTGLGLAICKKIVAMMGGEIWLDSIPEKGSRFYFTAVMKIKTRPAFVKPMVPEHIRNKKVLIVDDNPSTLMVIKRYMESFGFRTVLAETAEDAFIEYEQSQTSEPFSMILMDIRLPGTDGVTMARRIKQNSDNNTPPVIMISALGNEKEIKRARMAGVEGFLMKPIKQSLLFDTIMEIYGFDSADERLPTESAASFSRFTDSRILLVEDNPINQMVVQEMLNIPDLRIDIANNGNEAIDLIKTKSYDAVLMDVQMPEMDGLETTKIIRTKMKLKNIPIIAMTAHAMYGDREKCIAAGMNDYISKPVDRQILFSTLQKYINQPHPHSHSSVLKRPAIPPRVNSEAVKGLDIDEGLIRFGGSWNRYLNILRSFEATFSDQISKLKALIEQDKTNEAILNTHSLKGIAGNISAPDLFDASKSLETALRTPDNRVLINSCINALNYELNTVLNTIQLLPDTDDTDEPPTPEKTCYTVSHAFNSEDLSDFIKSLSAAIHSSDPVESGTLIEQIRLWTDTQGFPKDAATLIRNIETSVNDYNFDAAAVSLDILEKKFLSMNQ